MKTRMRQLLLPVLLALMMPQATRADGINETYNYLVTMVGLDQLKIQMPVYDEDGYDGWIDKGYIYVTPAGGIKYTLLYFYCEEKSGAEPKLYYQKGVNGAMTLTPGVFVDETATTEKQSCRVGSSSNLFKVSVLWTVPDDLRGKELTVSWSVHKEGNGPVGPAGESSGNISISDSKHTFPSIPEIIQPSLMDPMLGYDDVHAGQTMLIYMMGASEIKKLTARYTEVNGKLEMKKSVSVDPELTGFIYLDADKCYKDFRLEASYLDTEEKLRTACSDTIIVPTLHHAYNLTASLQNDGGVKLSWRCKGDGWKDIMMDDSWEVQRNTTGNLNAAGQWTNIGQVKFQDGDTIYTCTDNTLLDNYEGTIVYYRVRRTSTALWNWATGTYAQTALPFELRLPTVMNASARQTTWKEDLHKAMVSYEIGNKNQYDKDGRFILRTAADWETFADLVKNGQQNLNAIMVADIDLGKSLTMIGPTENKCYNGTFDGNGHTLTIQYDSVTTRSAPFRNVGSATIKNLHVAGRIITKATSCGSLVSRAVNGMFEILSCRSTVKIKSLISGDNSTGGLVGIVSNSSTAYIKNSVFEGQLLGEATNSCGGLIGFSWTKPVFKNCLFAPTRLTFSTKSSETFSRVLDQTSDFNTCYYTIPFDGTEKVTIDGKTYWVLRNEADWNDFIQKVMDANGNSDVNAIMANDFNIIYSVGYRSNIAYKGTFDGNGHTLCIHIQSPNNDYIAPFSRTKDATIRNLNVVGNVWGAEHPSGLVGSSEGSTLTIDNCHVSVHVFTTKTHAGGIIGHGHKVKNYVRNCLFDGTIEAETFNSKSYGGSIIGWEDGGTSNVVQNNLENGTYININHAGMNYNASSGGSPYGATNNWNTHEWNECNKVIDLTSTQLVDKLDKNNWQPFDKLAKPKQTTMTLGQGTSVYGMEPLELLALLNKEEGAGMWELAGNQPVPAIQPLKDLEYVTTLKDPNAMVILNVDKSVDGKVRYSERRELNEAEREKRQVELELVTSCVDHDFRLLLEQGSSRLQPLDTIGTTAVKAETGEAARYEFDNNVKLDSIKATTQQTSVTLTWKTTGKGDFYRITRRDKTEDEWVELEKAYDMETYIDKTVKPQHVYIYKVKGVNECEGLHEDSLIVEGFCEPTGMVRGYVRLPDGTAMANVPVTAEPQDTIYGITKTTKTDAKGFFEISGLPYVGQGSYHITAQAAGDEGTYTEFFANFNDETNLVSNAVLVQKLYFLFSGYVMYDGTSVPVVGAQFERDGIVVNNGSGQPVITDSQGKFTVSMPQGQHTIRVVKDGHVFADEGFYLDEDNDRKPNWQKGVAEYVFWDKTTVTLQGRVVGGDIQGDKPLGEMQSVNNLGDSLTIVMQLEGDNASYLVRDQLNASVTERHLDYCFGKNQLDTCHMDTYRHRLVIKPSPVTGEYSVPMLPVKYKVTEIYCEGYTTLFQAGKVGETLDLTDYVDKDVVTYSRIYHAIPTLAVKQFNMDGKSYMGIKQYTELDDLGNEIPIDLWNDTTGYAFNYPVFMAGSPIFLMLAAEEQYCYNNDINLRAPDVVHLPGGEVTIHNALIDTDEAETVKLDSLGEGLYRFTPQNLTFTEEGDMALKTLTMTLKYDNTFYDVQPINGEPIRGYVMAAKAKSQGRRVVADGGTFLIDILRDPPGATSTAYIENNSKLSYSFSQNLKFTDGLKMNFGEGSGGSNRFDGIWSGHDTGNTLGSISSVSSKSLMNVDILFTYYNSWQYNYSFETTERITTSSSASDVGADADVFIGMTQNAIVEDAIAVRAISDSTYQRLKARESGSFNIGAPEFDVKQGTLKVLAEGKNSNGQKVWLVRDEVLQAYTRLQSTFVHSVKYIEKELIPELFNLRNARLLDVTTDSATAKKMANHTGHAVYVSKVPISDGNFGQKNFYTQYNPTGKNFTDTIQMYNKNILTWVEFLYMNEREKLMATDLVKRYDIDGRSSVSYSESFGIGEQESRYLKVPLISGTNFDFSSIAYNSASSMDVGHGLAGDSTTQSIDIKVFSKEIVMKFQPIASLDYNYNYGQNTSQGKKIGFTLAPSSRSNLLVDVYRSAKNSSEFDKQKSAAENAGYKSDDKLNELFFQRPSEEYLDYVKSGAGYGLVGSLGGLVSYARGENVQQYRSLVYRTRGGATCEPYEDECKTKYFIPGTQLDAKTISIDNPRIWVEQASVSNVPSDEPARFTLHVANESELPAQATTTSPFTIYLASGSNPKGAKVYVDGHPLAGGGLDVRLNPNEVMTKTVEVYPGTEYDYDDIQLGIIDAKDPKRSWNCNISAHFVPVAGKVNISLPGNKWVVNTESAYDSKRQQFYMPVRIDGFDVNYRNFDHIELQYKLNTQGDKEWVNVCSFYKDSLLLAKATGERMLIEDDGKIMATFWGETDPIEQTYDLRAVNYCRYGNGFLTRSSEILTGIKDTRRPQLFGTPKPEDGILDIGEDIMLRFSEPIAGNYLRGLNNFQVLGQTNSSNIALSTDLRFNGDDGAMSLSPRNLSGKSFTLDMMVNPDQNDKAMTLFSHGTEDNRLEVGLTADRKLTVAIGDTVFVGAEIIPFKGLRQIEYVFNADIENKQTHVSLFDGSTEVGSFTCKKLYDGEGCYWLGVDQENGLDAKNYEGEMLEFRLWNRALTIGEMNEYAQKQLTGYELGLMDNYPLNEGQGSYSFNRVVSGGDLAVYNAAWNVPDGIGMKLDGHEGFRIEPSKFSRTNYQDYTMMFWFRTTDYEGTLLANGKAKDETDAKNHFNIGVHGGIIDLWLGGRNIQTDISVNDGGWHHLALTVSRSRNVGNLYVDKKLSRTFAVDTLGGISGGFLTAGVTMLNSSTFERPLNGNIDEIAMYEMALSENIIKATASMTPSGQEIGLMAYLSFGRNETQANNLQKLVPTGISLKRYRDPATGELTTQRDTLIAQDVIEQMYDKINYAPMRGVVALENIPYSFVAKDNELYINLDVPDYQIEKTNVMVTVKEVTDLNGNSMASPVTMDLYVYRNPLRWTDKQLTIQTQYGEEYTFKAVITNLSGRSRRFSLEGLPIWITASQYNGVVDALGELPITFTISPYINIGNFDEVIYLTGEDEMTEPLPLSIMVRGEAPNWVVDDQLLEGNISMSIIGQVSINVDVEHDKDDMLAAFNSEHRLLGVTHLDNNVTGIGSDGLAYLTVYNEDYSPIVLYFEFYDASTGIIHKVMPLDIQEDYLTFKRDTVIGTTTDPLLFGANNNVVQTIQLKKGWNWVSFNVNPEQDKVKNLLNNATKWLVGDGLEVDKEDGSHYLITYKAVANPKDENLLEYLWDYGDSIVSIDSRLMYRFYSNNDKQAYVAGYLGEDEIVVHKGWNRIGYISQLNLPIGTAMSIYAENGSDGDIIKSQSEFAVLSVDAFGNKQWKGTLKYLRVGEGYMLKRNADSEVSFYYPAYLSNSRYRGDANAKRAVPLFQNTSGTSMTVVAKADGVEVEQGDRLVAYRGNEVCGIAEADEQGMFYLNVGDVDVLKKALTFTLEREEEVLAVTTRSQMDYQSNAALGTPDEPTTISFTTADGFDTDGWYTMTGIKLAKQPRMRGVYIHNNKKVIVE